MLLATDELKCGDVVLCLPDSFFNITRRVISWKTKSRYTHAAIYLGDSIFLEAVRPAVTKAHLAEFLKRYAHVAVFRQPDAWGIDRQNALKLFASKSVEAKARYNLSGALSIDSSKAEHVASVFSQLEEYFQNPKTLPVPSKPAYFCSELVVDCFIATGFIHQSAAVVFQGHTYAPVDLSNEPTFGTFLGYMTSRKRYSVLASDEFYCRSTFNEIFGGTGMSDAQPIIPPDLARETAQVAQFER